MSNSGISHWYRKWHKNPYHPLLHWSAVGVTSIAFLIFVHFATKSYSSEFLASLDPLQVDSAMAMNISVAADRVNFGTDFIPRRNDLPNKLIVPAGQTVELPANSTYDYIEVAGTLHVPRNQDTVAKFTTMIILPGGLLDAGTQADPIPCNRKVEFIIRDVPINHTFDPFEWGNGLVNFGRQTRVGCSKTSFVQASGSIAAGATSINLATAPSGWQVGDEVLIPDTVTPAPNPGFNVPSRRESKVTITAINGTSLTLSKGLDFAHPNIVDPQGVVVLRPRVADLTRNIYLHSENPNGNRGHTADIGHGTTWDVRYNQFYGLGRTQNIALDDYSAATGHIGTNQRGRYTEHHHHAESSVGSQDIGNVYVSGGSPLSKWGLAVHGTSDVLVDSNIAVDFPGAGIVTEDGYEVRDIFRNNLSVGTIGNSEDSRKNAEVNVCPGCEGSGFWFRGIINTFQGNEAWNNRTGINLFNQDQVSGMFPSTPGGPLDTPLTPHQLAVPILMTDNITAANSFDGLETWATTRFPNTNLTTANNTDSQFFAVSSDQIENYFVNPKVICTTGDAANGIDSNQNYVSSFEMAGGQVAGCAVGIHGGGGIHYFKVTNATLQNQVNVDELSVQGGIDLENDTHLPLAGYPHKYIVMDGNNYVWDGNDPLPPLYDGHVMFPQRGSRFMIKNWQGTGQDYLLFVKQSLGNNPAPYSAPFSNVFNTPVKGLTLQQSWDTFGIGYWGDMLKNTDAITLDGILNGYARAGLNVAFPPPRAIVTYPTLRQVATVEDNSYVRINAILTGDPNGASNVMMVSLDGGAPLQVWNGTGDPTDDPRQFTTNNISPGLHTVKVWRTQKNSPTVELAGSEYTSQYCIASCPNVPQAHISLSPTTVNFTGVSGGATPANKTVTITNTGTAPLNGSFSLNQNWCGVGVDQSVHTLAPGASLPITINVAAPSNVGSFVCNVTVTDAAADNTPQAITVNYTVSPSGSTPPPSPDPNPPPTSFQRTINIAILEGRATKVISASLQVLNSSKTLIKSYPFTTDASGNATVTFDIAAQTGFLKIKVAPFLTRIVSVDLNSNTTYNFTKLSIGDINQDNIVNSIDFSAMNAKWFTTDAASDLNQDGLVNSLDFSLMNKNWFVAGDQ